MLCYVMLMGIGRVVVDGKFGYLYDQMDQANAVNGLKGFSDHKVK